MENSKALDFEMKWISEVSGQAKKRRAQIVAWNAVRSTVNALITSYNRLDQAQDSHKRANQRQRLQIKKILLALLYEMEDCIDKWARSLRSDGLLTGELAASKKAFKSQLKAFGAQLEEFRQHAFHLRDFDLRPNQLVSVYERIDAVRFKQLRRVLKSAMRLGEDMRRAVTAGT